MIRPTVRISPYRFSLQYASGVLVFIVLLSFAQAGYFDSLFQDGFFNTGDVAVRERPGKLPRTDETGLMAQPASALPPASYDDY